MELRLAQLEHNRREKKPEMRPKQCVFDSRNGRTIMEYYSHLFVAYATAKKNAENTVFIRLLGRNLSSLIHSRVFLRTTRVGQKIAMRPQFAQKNARPQDESIQLVPRASKMKPFGT